MLSVQIFGAGGNDRNTAPEHFGLMGVAHGPLRRRHGGKGRAVPARPSADPPSLADQSGGIVMNTTDVEAALANCRALIDQINAGLSAEEPFVDVSSATELLFYLERAASALKRSPSRSREREETKIALNYRWC
jgi:hypothetical protein